METLCIENYEFKKKNLRRAKGKYVSLGWIMIGEKMFPREKICGHKDRHGWKRHSFGLDVSLMMDNGWGEVVSLRIDSGQREGGPRENTFLKNKMCP